MPQVTFLTVPMRPCSPARPPAGIVAGFGSLHRANLEDAAGLLDDLFNQLSFVDGQRERFLAVDVFPSVHRFDRDLRVPVVGRGDHDRVDVFSVENVSIVFIRIRFLALPLRHLFDVCAQHVRIDVGEGCEVGKAKRLAGDSPSLISKPNGCKDWAVIS